MKLPIRITSDGTQAGTSVVDADGNNMADIVRTQWSSSCHIDPSKDDIYHRFKILIKFNDPENALNGIPSGFSDNPKYKKLLNP